MSEGTKTVRIVTHDEALLAAARGAVSGLEGWNLSEPQSVEHLISGPPGPEDVILLDAWLRSENVYESCRRLTGRVRCRIFVVTDERNDLAETIASFCGASGIVERPLSAESLRGLLAGWTSAQREFPEEARHDEAERSLPRQLVDDLVSGSPNRIIDALIDPDTGLFSFDYLSFKLDEEFKRSKRFRQPLTCVMLGFDGQADEEVLGQLAGIFLNASRDTDVLGRFDESSFLFFLPNTGPDGAKIMAQRIQRSAIDQGLRDLVGDLLDIDYGLASCPHAEVERREDLFSRAREAFQSAQRSQ